MTEEQLLERVRALEQKVDSLRKRKRAHWIPVSFVVAIFILLVSATVAKPYTFAAGQTISSSEVNANFDALYTAINGNIDSANLASDAGSLQKVSGGLITASGSSIGIGTVTPASKLDVAGTVKMSGLSLTTNPSAGYVLTSDASGAGTWQPAPVTSKGFGDAQQTSWADSGWFGNSFTQIAQVTVTVAAGQKVLLMISGDVASSPGGGVIVLRLPVGYDHYVMGTVNGVSYPFAYQYLDTTSAGTVTYTLQAENNVAGDQGKIYHGELIAIVG